MRPFEFMRRIKPAGTLLCIAEGYEAAAAFTDEIGLNTWIERNQGKNLYWMPNATGILRPCKSAITSGRLLHVDIDHGRNGTHLADDPAAKEAMIAELRADGFTAIADTGGGIQGYVVLKEPMPREEIEARNYGLIQRYAPHDQGTWNIDRLLRIPGTTNFPNEAKIAKGRVVTQSSVIEAYGPVRNGEDFAPFYERQAKAAASYKFGPVDIDDDKLPELPAPLIALIRDMDDSGFKQIGDGSGSAKARRAILLMLKHGLRPETIKGFCMSANWSLGLYFRAWCDDHQGADLEAEVERQITKAMSALKDYEAEADAQLKEALDSYKEEKEAQGVRESRLKLEDVADMPDEDEEEAELVPGWAPASGLVEIFGPPKAGKSWFSIDLALHIATGLPWCGVPVQQAPVVYLIGEGRAEIRKRVRAWYRSKGVARKPGQIRFLYRAVKLKPDVVKQLALDNPGVFDGARAVFVDTVNRYMAGDENSTNDMSAFVEMCDRLRGPWCLFALHHTGRANEQRPRGSNVLDAAVDAKISVTRNRKTGQTIVKVDESRSGATPKPMAFRINPFEYAPGKVAGVLEMAEAVKVSDRAFLVLQHLYDYPNDKQKDIVAALADLNDNAVSRAIKELVNNQMLTPKTGRSDLGDITSKGIEYLKTMMGDDFRENEEFRLEEVEDDSSTKTIDGTIQKQRKSPAVQSRGCRKISLRFQRLRHTRRNR